MKCVNLLYLPRCTLFSIAFISLGYVMPSLAGGVALSATRIIYPEVEKQVSINVTNYDDKESFLVQSWVVDKLGVKSTSFIVSPLLFVLKPGKMNMLRIMYNGPALPEGKESIFYLNNKAIPSVEKKSQAGNTLQIASQSVIKLFVRPKHLSVNPSEAPAMLRCQLHEGGLIISNTSPYFVTLVNFNVDGKKQPNTMVPPLSSETVRPSGATKGAVTYQTLNDYGAITPALACKA